MLTASDYTAITGQPAPDEFDFVRLRTDAWQQLDVHTLQLFSGMNIMVLPGIIRAYWQRALAWQMYYLHQQGGVAAQAVSGAAAGFSLGDLTVNSTGTAAAADELSPAVRSLLPTLIAFGRGLHNR